MKIFKDNIVYVQLEDLNYIIKKELDFPKNLIPKTIEQGYVFIDEKNQYNFIGYNEKNIVEYFKNLELIVDYDNIKNLSADELNRICNRLLHDKELSKEDEYDSIEYKYYQINKFLSFKEGNEDLNLPEGVDYPKKDSIFKKIFKK